MTKKDIGWYYIKANNELIRSLNADGDNDLLYHQCYINL